MKMGPFNCASRCTGRMVKGQAMTEFLFAGFVALIVLFVAIQMAAIGREYMALGELNYQVTRWATNLKNNTIVGTNSPQCTDVKNLIQNVSAAPYSTPPASAPVATGYMGKVASNGVNCGAAPTGGIGVAMACIVAGGSTTTPCAAFAYRKGFRKPTFFPFAWLSLAIRAAMSGATALVPPDLTSDESTRTR